MTQPLTVRQISRRTEIPLNICRHIVRELVRRACFYCLNDPARRSRLFWLNEWGKACQRQLLRLWWRAHLRYELTEVGRTLRSLLQQAGVPV